MQDDEIDITLGDERAIRYEIQQYMHGRRDELVFLAKPLSRRGLRIGVSRQHPRAENIAADFNQAIREMYKEGSYQTIIEKY